MITMIMATIMEMIIQMKNTNQEVVKKENIFIIIIKKIIEFLKKIFKN